MTIKPKFYGKKAGRRFSIDDEAGLQKYLEKFEDGQALEITIAAKFKRRTQGDPGEDTNFNGYYWAVPIRMISDEMGELDDNVTHNILQMLFNKRGVRMVDGSGKMTNVEIPRGTKEMSGVEFAEYCSKIRMWASLPKDQGGLGLYIPEPHEAEYDQR